MCFPPLLPLLRSVRTTHPSREYHLFTHLCVSLVTKYVLTSRCMNLDSRRHVSTVDFGVHHFSTASGVQHDLVTTTCDVPQTSSGQSIGYHPPVTNGKPLIEITFHICRITLLIPQPYFPISLLPRRFFRI